MPIKVEIVDVKDAFDDLGLNVEEGPVVDRITSLCDMYGVDGDKVATEFLAWAMSKKLPSDTPPNLEYLDAFEKETLMNLKAKQRDMKAQNVVDVTSLFTEDGNGDMSDLASCYGVSSAGSTPSAGDKTANKRLLSTPENGNVAKKMLGGGLGQSPFSPASLKVESPAGAGKYSQRTNRGDTLIAYGEGVAELGPSSWKLTNNNFGREIKHYDENRALKTVYRYMHESLRDKAGILDETICKLADIMTERAKEAKAPVKTEVKEEAEESDEAEEKKKEMLENEEPQSFMQISHEPMIAVGRVCCDVADGRLNPHSVLLQGNQDLTQGRTLPLDLSRVAEYALFPGQIIRATAINPNGSKLMAGKISADASPALPTDHDWVN